MKHSLHSLYLTPNDFWLFPELKPALKGLHFRILKT